MNDALGATARTPDEGRPNASVGRHLVLVGMMGSGKTTVGRLVAERLERAYVDNDALVRAIAGEEPAAIRYNRGETVLHDFEATALRRALAGSDLVVASAAAAVVEEPRSRAVLDDA